MNKFYMLLIPMLALMSMPAEAKPHQLTWLWPTLDCDDLPITEADLIESELIYDVLTMPMPSDTTGPCDAVSDPGAPAGSVVVPIPIATTVVTLNLKPGETYYARIRVSAYVNGNWSSWSAQAEFTVPYGRPRKIILSDGLVQYESILIDGVTELNLGKKES